MTADILQKYGTKIGGAFARYFCRICLRVILWIELGAAVPKMTLYEWLGTTHSVNASLKTGLGLSPEWATTVYLK